DRAGRGWPPDRQPRPLHGDPRARRGQLDRVPSALLVNRRRTARTLPVAAAPVAVASTPADEYVQHCDTARTLLAADRPADAAQAALRALAVLPRGAEAHRLRGLALLENGELRPAVTAFHAALAVDP